MKRIFSLFFFLIVQLSLLAGDPRPLVCLNMIVKNESAVITRCLSSVKPLIDYWVIVDTGSSDKTQDIIKDYMKDVPGELHERPWKNFEHNRNEALVLAKGKGDYVLFIDADEIFEYPSNYHLPLLDRDFYHMTTKFGGTEYARVQFINNHLPWRWKGVLHEGLECPFAFRSGHLEGIYNIVHTDGARSQDPLKYQKDVAVLEEALRDDPKNTRNIFYLAQSYKDAGNYEKAIENYQKRSEMGGWDEEIYMCHFQIAVLKQCLEREDNDIIASYYKAFKCRPTRSEPLGRLAEFHRKKEQYTEGYVVAKAALTLPVPNDLLFVEKWSYDYGTLLECSICAYWLGKYQECHDMSIQILSLKDLPQPVKECVERNLAFAKEKLH